MCDILRIRGPCRWRSHIISDKLKFYMFIDICLSPFTYVYNNNPEGCRPWHDKKIRRVIV